MNVIILGGGIGGLATALSLHAAGITCRVYESSDQIKPLGVGINVLPHSVRELTELGLQTKLDAIGIRTEELVYATKRGEIIWREPRGTFAGYREAARTDPRRGAGRGDAARRRTCAGGL